MYKKFLSGFALLLALHGCGGSGGDGGVGFGPGAGERPALPEYNGKRTAATVTKDNAVALLRAVFAETSASAVDLGRSVNSVTVSVDADASHLWDRILKRATAPALASARRVASGSATRQVVNDVVNGPLGGTATVVGDVDVDGTGYLNVEFAEYRIDGVTMNGSMTMVIDEIDGLTQALVSGEMRLLGLSIGDARGGWRLTGTIEIATDVAALTETAVDNLLAEELNASHGVLVENLRTVTRSDQLGAPLRSEVDMTGRIYDSIEGYVDVTTEQPMVMNPASAARFNAGGRLVLTGAAKSTLRLEPYNDLFAGLALDGAGNGEFSSIGYLKWGTFGLSATASGDPVIDFDPNEKIPPTIVSITPARDSMDAAIDQPIVIEFSEPINPQSVTPELFEIDTGGFEAVSGVWTVSVNKLTFTPARPFAYGETYVLRTWCANCVTDLAGNNLETSSTFDATFWPFAIIAYPTYVDTGVQIDQVYFDTATNLAYVLDRENKKMAVVDAASKSISYTMELLYKPSDICVDNAAQRAYIVNYGNTFISEIDMGSRAKVADIPWPVTPADGPTDSEPVHFHIYCRSDKLYVVDAKFVPTIVTIARALPHTAVSHATEIDGVGGLVFAANGKTFYSWYQFGWSAGSMDSYVRKHDISATGVISTKDKSTLSYPTVSRDPLDTPIFLDEATGRVFNKRVVFNANNLTQVYFTFNEGEDIYALNLDLQRMASKTTIYNSTTYDVVAPIPVRNIARMFFGNDGALFLSRNNDTRLYYGDFTAAP